MSAPECGGAEGAARRVRVLRLETLRDIKALLRELEELHSQLLACQDSDGERVRDLLHAAGVMTGVWLDDIACRFAETDHDADELFARAWQFVEDLELAPGGFLTRDDPALFTTQRVSAAEQRFHGRAGNTSTTGVGMMFTTTNSTARRRCPLSHASPSVGGRPGTASPPGQCGARCLILIQSRVRRPGR
ncbi:hypothetical protein ACFQ71_20095 [Streptomyces sp. NPDC056534]|uniref:hypothetical protein n=1 Tax=Streptomyces sp. NPDC056534 TaxID=3345857 RepID=UPI0036981D96